MSAAAVGAYAAALVIGLRLGIPLAAVLGILAVSTAFGLLGYGLCRTADYVEQQERRWAAERRAHR